jgi:glycine oxidase
MLAPQIEAHAGDPLLAFAIAAREQYRALAQDLAAAGHDIGHHPDGILHVAFDEAGASTLAAQAEAQRVLGLEAEYWDRAALRAKVAGIGDGVPGGLFAAKDGSVDVEAVLRALLADGAARGVHRIAAAADAVLTGGGRVTGVRAGSDTYTAPAVVVAAGAWAPRLAGLPRPLPIEPVRGQMALTPWPAGETRLVLFGPGGYVVPRGDHAVLGSTMEHAGFEPRTTAEGIEHIRLTTGRMLPALLTWPILRTWAGLRPLTTDGLPIISTDPDCAGLVYACGHGRNGILLGPLTGEVVRDLVVRGETGHEIGAYSVMRFGR